MATVAIVKGGMVTTVYDDKWIELFSALGDMKIERQTNVEWDSIRQEWVATRRGTGEVIASGINRAAVIKTEIDYLEKELMI